ncbi:MAG: RNA polymerase sigma-70 factor (ECF subfamily) [Flavobacteriaceae bacterium]|jgi:RNA polymerase sigma-70 factor (ECF subfamily)
MGLFSKDIASFSDEQLIALLSTKRKNEALTQLHTKYAKRVLGFFVKMLRGDVEKAQDFTQELFMRILEKHGQFDPTRKFYTWMFTIASNMCKTEFRKPILNRLSGDEHEFNQSAQWNELGMDKKAFREALDKAINKLGGQHQLTFVLRYMQEVSLNEISEITNVSLGTVKSRLFYATKKVTEGIREFNPSGERIGKSFSDGTNNTI